MASVCDSKTRVCSSQTEACSAVRAGVGTSSAGSICHAGGDGGVGIEMDALSAAAARNAPISGGAGGVPATLGVCAMQGGAEGASLGGGGIGDYAILPGAETQSVTLTDA